MTNPAAAPTANAVSQASQDSSVGVLTQTVDVGMMEIGPVAGVNDSFPESDFLSPLVDRGESASSIARMPPLGIAAPVEGTRTVGTMDEGRGSRKSSKAKFRYSNRKLLAPLEFYLDPRCRGFFTERTKIVGQVKACARASNNNRYRIEWKRSGVAPLPAALNPVWLREWYPKEMEADLKKVIARYDDVYPYWSGTIEVNVDGERVTGTPPTLTRGMAASAFRTASTIASQSVSTMTDSNTSFRSTRSRVRASPDQFDSMRDSDVEDGSDMDENDCDPIRISRDCDL